MFPLPLWTTNAATFSSMARSEDNQSLSQRAPCETTKVQKVILAGGTRVSNLFRRNPPWVSYLRFIPVTLISSYEINKHPRKHLKTNIELQNGGLKKAQLTRTTNKQRNKQTKKQRNKQTNKQTQTDRQTNTDRQTDKQASKQTNKHRQTDRQTNKQTNTDRQTNKHRQTNTDRQTDKQTDTQTDKQTDKQTNRHTDRQTDRQTNKQTSQNWSPMLE